jgi:VTC domain
MVGVSQVAPPRDRSIASLLHEIKYVLPAGAADSVGGWLGAVVRPEHAHPPAWVVSVYFDTPALSLLYEKVNSDYYKTKVRVRWYRAPGGGASAAFVEMKRRIGNRREKRRVPLGIGGDTLAGWPLDDPRWLLQLAPLRAEAPLPAGLAPVLRLQYFRTRFVDAGASARLAVDQRITVAAVSPHLRALPAVLPDAVFEWKGPSVDLPAYLAPVTRFGARRRSFSKYLACVRAVCPLLA